VEYIVLFRDRNHLDQERFQRGHRPETLYMRQVN